MYISPLERMKKIHIWVGTIEKSENEYLKYFELDNTSCQFCEDLGIEFYDEDFIGILPIYDRELSINEILNDIPIDENDKNNVVSVCKSFGMEKANATVYLTDSSIEISNPYKENYNGLKYIGMFDSDL